MPEPTKDQGGKNPRFRGQRFALWREVEGHGACRPFYVDDPAPPTPPDPPPAADMVPRAEVDRLIAKETAKKGRELGEKLAALETETKTKTERLAEVEAELTALQSKAGADAETVRQQLQGQIRKLTDELGETRKTLAAVQTRADTEALRSVAERLASTATQGKDRLRDALASQLRRKPDGAVVWVDPETDEECEPAKGLEAFKKSDPYFWAPLPSGSGASAGSPPVAGRKTLTTMTREEKAAAADRELSGL